MKAKVALRKKREGAENNVLVMRIGTNGTHQKYLDL